MIDTMEKDYQRVWAECLGFIKDNLPGKENEKVFSTWFEPIVPVKLDGNTLIIQVPSPFFYEWLEQNYADLLKKAIQLTLGNEAGLQYSIVMATSISESPVTTRMPSTGLQSTINPPKDIPMTLNHGDNHEFPNPFVIPGLKKVRINRWVFPVQKVRPIRTRSPILRQQQLQPQRRQHSSRRLSMR